MSFVENFIFFPTVQKLWKFIRIW